MNAQWESANIHPFGSTTGMERSWRKSEVVRGGMFEMKKKMRNLLFAQKRKLTSTNRGKGKKKKKTWRRRT